VASPLGAGWDVVGGTLADTRPMSVMVEVSGPVAVTGASVKADIISMASGAAGSALDQIGQWPMPAWLAPWVDPAWVETMQASVLEWLQWLSAAMPAIGGLMGWISPLVWLLWGLGLVVLLCVGGGLHFLARRFDRVVPA